MSMSNWIDEGHLAPPPVPRTPVRNSQNGSQTTIMIEPTVEYQQFYNQTRRDMDRQRLEYHVTEENSLEPPKAQSMSRSTTSDSLPSPSTVCSHADDGGTPFPPNHATEAVRSRPPRGKRTGPLDMETRTKTAFKRKFKLTCQFHRTKKISCNCHDFSKLEAAYIRSRADERRKNGASGGRPVRPFGDLGTFGAGGAAPATIPRYQNFDLSSDLPTGLIPQVHANLRSVLDFDIQSEASVNAIVTAPREAPFYIPVSIPVEFAIGSSMPYRNRWECRYQHTMEETGSLASMGPCSWTGPLEQLADHFTTQHHPFVYPEQPCRSICSRCEAETPGWVDDRACREPDKCASDDWQKWLYGIPAPQSRTLPSRLTVSEASGSRTSWFSPPWNLATPSSSNTEHSNLPYSSYTGNSSFQERLSSAYENSEAGEGDENNEACHVCEELRNRCICCFNATNTTRHCCIGNRLPLSRWKRGGRCTLYDPCLSIPSRLQPSLRLLVSLLAPLIFFHFAGDNFLIYLRDVLLAFSTSTYCVKWYLTLTILGSLIACIAIGSLRTTSYREVSDILLSGHVTH
ncbi:hypothetical protein F4859DRAFT_254200 [Xylaria cf. heliscus]|nr:hypothetical protein F4859DRAFT_254200 [Xylaria cf. heliscus]